MRPLPLWILAALIGPCLGSYATTAALRRADGVQSTWGRSRCDHCGASLGLASTTPIISFVALRGACATCGGPINVTHLLGELTGGLIVLLAILTAPVGRAVGITILGLLMLSSAVHDWKTRKLPNDLTLAIAAIAALLSLVRSTETLLEGVISAVVSFALLEIVRRGFLWLAHKPGLGFGDVKLLSALALWTGVATPWVVALAALVGLCAALIRPSSDGRLAFGPCIAIAAWLVGISREAHLWPVLA
jgi:leader peptidase (prepilin peptidase)/N-methyltransferase